MCLIFYQTPIKKAEQAIAFLKDKHSLASLNYLKDPAGQFKLIENKEWNQKNTV